MGATMHAHIEVKKNGIWHHYASPNITRDYLVFACINGTRKEAFEGSPDIYKQINPVTGQVQTLPNDMSEVTRICLDIDRELYILKSFSVLSAEDLETLQKRLNEIVYRCVPERAMDLEEDIFKTYIGGGSIAAHRGFDDVRVILWFDN